MLLHLSKSLARRSTADLKMKLRFDLYGKTQVFTEANLGRIESTFLKLFGAQNLFLRLEYVNDHVEQYVVYMNRFGKIAEVSMLQYFNEVVQRWTDVKFEDSKGHRGASR